MYVKSHANYEPGEQRHRGYNWVDKDGAIDPSTHRFGGKNKGGMINGVAKAFNPALDEEWSRPPMVVEKRLEDFRELNSESLGGVKNLGFGSRPSPINYMFVFSQDIPTLHSGSELFQSDSHSTFT